MIFLSGAAGFTALIGGGSLTLLWYFLKLRRRPLRVSSTLLWAKAARDLEVNAPLRWIRPSWLLLLQLLAVAFFSAAIGRPALSGAEGAPERWVVVIDRSASMSATDGDGGGTRLDEAIRRAETIIGRMGNNERAMVASFAGSARLDAVMTPNKGVLRTSLEGIRPTDQPADFAAAIELVAAQLGDDSSGARIVILSDGAFETPPVATPLGAVDVRYVRVGPPESEPARNTGIVALSARRDPDDPAALRMFIRIRHAGTESRDATVSLFFNDELVGAETLTVDPGGEAAVVLDTRRIEAGILRAEIAGRDTLESDDDAWVVVPAARAPGAVVVSPDGVGVDPFLLRALEVATRQPATKLALSEWELGAAPRSSFVVFDRCEPEAEPVEPTLHLGAGAPFAGVGLVRYEATSARRVLAWERVHPVMRYLTLDAVVIAGAPALVWDDTTAVRTLARSDDGPLAVAIESGAVRRLIFAFGPDGSNWETDPSFALFLALAAEWLSPSTTGSAVSYTTSEGISIPALLGAEEATATGPENRTAIVRQDGLARFGEFEFAGVYTVTGATQKHLAINLLSEAESELATRDALTVAGQGVAASGANAISVHELWRWFVLAGLLLASLEWLIYARKMRV